MSGPHHEGAGHGAAPPGVHLPAPSLSPAIIGLGVFVVSYGLLYAVPLLVIGAVILLFGIVTWLVDDAKVFMSHGDGHGGGH